MRRVLALLLVAACQFGLPSIPAATRQVDLSAQAAPNLDRAGNNALANVELYDHTGGRFQRTYRAPNGFWWNPKTGQYMVRLSRADSMTSENFLTVWLVPQDIPDTFAFGAMVAEAGVYAMLLDGANVSVEVDRPHGIVQVHWDGKWNGGNEEHPLAGKLIAHIEWREGATLPQPPPPPPPPSRSAAVSTDMQPLVGAWAWNDDVMELAPNGTGRYLRKGEVCYELTYTVAGDTLATTADRDHPCGAGRNQAFRFIVNGSTLQLTHVKSGFQSAWQRR